MFQDHSVDMVDEIEDNLIQANHGPYFDVAVSKNVTALIGKTAYLNCRIRSLGNRTVSTRVKEYRKKLCFYLKLILFSGIVD